MPARGWHQDPQVARHLRIIRGNGAPAPMPTDEAQTAMVRIIWEVADALEGGAGELRHLARRVTPGRDRQLAESPHAEGHT